MFSIIQSIGNALWGALPGMGPLFDDSSPTFPGNRLNPELVYHIFTFLPPVALARASCVSKVWQDLASRNSLWRAIELKQIPRVTVFDQAFWEEYVDLAALGLNFEGLPEVDNCVIIPVLKELLNPGVIEEDAGASILIWPNGVDYDILSTLAQTPKKGHPTQFRNISTEMLRRRREIPASQACIFVLSNNVLKGSRAKNDVAHEKQVRGIGCEKPQLLPLATLAILTHMSSGTKLYGDRTWTRCSEKIRLAGRKYWVFVGGFEPGGLEVYLDDDRFVFGNGGVGALWKFPAIGT